jgi:fatty acid desaturase
MIHRTADTSGLAQARELVADLFEPKPWIYWTDFLVSALVGYTAAAAYLLGSRLWIQGVGLLISSLALYRLSLFMHEIVHFRRRQMQAFKVAWNLFAGVPLLTPSFFYESHIAHHNTQHYGTEDDGEYLPLGNGTVRDILLFLSQVFVQPLFVFIRFLLTPVTFLHPRLRRWTLERASSFVINFRYRRPIPENAPLWTWAVMDLLCSARAWCLLGTVAVGLHPWTHIPKLYGLAVCILTLNYVRTLLAHHYTNDGRPMTHEQQLLDSTVITGGPWIELLCPVGLRYHALHHLFPSLPYHNLSLAHQRLMANLPADSSYRRVVYPHVWAVLKTLRSNMQRAAATRLGNTMAVGS